MNDTYSAYLQSEAWNQKRTERLKLSRFQCDACGTKERLQIHHLTYERIFREDVADLMTLCELHHRAAEEMIGKGVIPRKGCVSTLATETLKFIAPRVKGDLETYRPRFTSSQPPRKKQKRTVHGLRVDSYVTPAELRNQLLADPVFSPLLKLQSRKEFKRAMRRMFSNAKRKARIMSNAIILYDQRNNA